MTTTTRWYVLGLPTPRDLAGGRHVIVGWAKTVEAADERVAKLQRQGRQGYALVAANRKQARTRAKKLFDINVAWLQKVPVRMQYKSCELQVRSFGQPGWAASDNCGVQAWFVVHMPNGHEHYRCAEHKSTTYLPEHPFYATHGGHGTAREYTYVWST